MVLMQHVCAKQDTVETLCLHLDHGATAVHKMFVLAQTVLQPKVQLVLHQDNTVYLVMQDTTCRREQVPVTNAVHTLVRVKTELLYPRAAEPLMINVLLVIMDTLLIQTRRSVLSTFVNAAMVLQPLVMYKICAQQEEKTSVFPATLGTSL